MIAEEDLNKLIAAFSNLECDTKVKGELYFQFETVEAFLKKFFKRIPDEGIRTTVFFENKEKMGHVLLKPLNGNVGDPLLYGDKVATLKIVDTHNSMDADLALSVGELTCVRNNITDLLEGLEYD